MSRCTAKVTWISKAAGGRSSLPTGDQYVAVSRFPEDGLNWPDGAWSVVLEFSSPASEQGNPSVGTARFLSEEAPLERLRPGRVFELYEGLHQVATVELIDGC